MKTYLEYINEEKSKTATFTFGRYNPMTVGHQKLFDAVFKNSNSKKDTFIFGSNSSDSKKNPLTPADKLKFLKLMFPKYAGNMIIKSDIRNVFEIAVWLYDRGYQSVRMVVGSDRVGEFKRLLGKYNGVKAGHGFYNFSKVEIISAGERDPDATGVEGMSASKMRKAVQENDFDSFKMGVPKSFNKTQELFDAVKKGLKI